MIALNRLKSHLLAGALALIIAGGGAVHAQPFPSKPIRIVVPFAPGGGNDVFARVVGQKMWERMGQPVIVENKVGAGGNIGAEFVAKSPPDGYTILVAQNGLTMLPWVQKVIPFDPMGFAPIGIALTLPMGATVNNDLPVKSISELITYARANPGKLSYATYGVGSPHHLWMELFMSQTGTNMVMVPYKSASVMLLDLTAGRVNVAFGALNSVLPLIQAGKIRAIGVGERKRLALLPDVPTVAESVPGYEVGFWFGFVAPAGTPPAITSKLSEETRTIVNLSDVTPRLRQVGFEINPGTPEEMRSIMQSDYEKWGRVVKAAGIQAE
jgi:tripartite-type tricarboxylate transporter receptor subunit TctC